MAVSGEQVDVEWPTVVLVDEYVAVQLSIFDAATQSGVYILDKGVDEVVLGAQEVVDEAETSFSFVLVRDYFVIVDCYREFIQNLCSVLADEEEVAEQDKCVDGVL